MSTNNWVKVEFVFQVHRDRHPQLSHGEADAALQEKAALWNQEVESIAAAYGLTPEQVRLAYLLLAEQRTGLDGRPADVRRLCEWAGHDLLSRLPRPGSGG